MSQICFYDLRGASDDFRCAFDDFGTVIWELQAFGYPQARQLLYHERVRERLDAICAEASESPTEPRYTSI